MSAHGKIAVVISLVLGFPVWPSGRTFTQEKGGTMSVQISSTAFSPGETVPKKSTCDARMSPRN